MITIKDVARHSGTSISTVSHVINNTRYVNPDLSSKVNESIAILGYEVNPLARGLKSKKTMTIGVLLTNMNRIFYPPVLKGIQTILYEAGYTIFFCESGDESGKEKNQIQTLKGMWIDGLIIDSVVDTNDKDYFNNLANLGGRSRRIPIISLERQLADFGIDSVVVENRLGGRVATQHLIECGCRNIAHIGALGISDTDAQRKQGFIEVLQEAGIECNAKLIKNGDFSPESGYIAMQEIINSGERFDGVFAANDQMAIGAIYALKSQGLAIPDQVKIVGYDNTFVSTLIDPQLTTINVDKYKLGVEAARHLLKKLEPHKRSRTSPAQSVQLIIRTSTDASKKTGWDLKYW